MGFFRKIAELANTAAAERMASQAGKSVARVMLFSALAAKHHYGSSAPNYGFLAGKALSTRPRWRQVSENTFQFEENGTVIEIADNMSLKDVVHLVVEVEIRDAVDGNFPHWQAQQLLRLAHHEADAFLQHPTK